MCKNMSSKYAFVMATVISFSLSQLDAQQVGVQRACTGIALSTVGAGISYGLNKLFTSLQTKAATCWNKIPEYPELHEALRKNSDVVEQRLLLARNECGTIYSATTNSVTTTQALIIANCCLAGSLIGYVLKKKFTIVRRDRLERLAQLESQEGSVKQGRTDRPRQTPEHRLEEGVALLTDNPDNNGAAESKKDL